MYKEDFCLVMTVLIAVMSLTYGGYWFGRRVEKSYWIHYLPDEMNSLCLECAGLKHTPRD